MVLQAGYETTIYGSTVLHIFVPTHIRERNQFLNVDFELKKKYAAQYISKIQNCLFKNMNQLDSYERILNKMKP